jgi:hypothetical protein
MSKNKKTAASELDITGLLALKTYERPEKERAEKSIQNIMREVRSADRMPSLLLFPDKSFAWMFAQPRYGVAALFIIFLGLHLLDRPMPVMTSGPVAIIKGPGAEIMAAVDTNHLKAAAVPGLTPPFSIASEAKPVFASYNE